MMFVPSPVHGDIMCEDTSRTPSSTGHFPLFEIQHSSNQSRMFIHFAMPLSRQPRAGSNEGTLNRPTGVTAHVPRSLATVMCVCHPQTKSCFFCTMSGGHLTFNISRRGCGRVPSSAFFCSKGVALKRHLGATWDSATRALS